MNACVTVENASDCALSYLGIFCPFCPICYVISIRTPGINSAVLFGHFTLRWRHNDLDGVSNHQPHDCLLNRLFGRISKKTSKLRVTGLCAGNSPWTGDLPTQMASNAEKVSIWLRHHVKNVIRSAEMTASPLIATQSWQYYVYIGNHLCSHW